MVGLCEEFVDFGSSVQWAVPWPIVEHFRLTKLSDEETRHVVWLEIANAESI